MVRTMVIYPETVDISTWKTPTWTPLTIVISVFIDVYWLWIVSGTYIYSCGRWSTDISMSINTYSEWILCYVYIYIWLQTLVCGGYIISLLNGGYEPILNWNQPVDMWSILSCLNTWDTKIWWISPKINGYRRSICWVQDTMWEEFMSFTIFVWK